WQADADTRSVMRQRCLHGGSPRFFRIGGRLRRKQSRAELPRRRPVHPTSPCRLSHHVDAACSPPPPKTQDTEKVRQRTTKRTREGNCVYARALWAKPRARF